MNEILPDWVNVYYLGPPTFIHFMLSRLPTHDRERVLLGILWHGAVDTFEWVEDRWTGFGAKLTTYEERERDIRWKNAALHQLGLVDDSAPSCAAHATSQSSGPGAGGNRGL